MIYEAGFAGILKAILKMFLPGIPSQEASVCSPVLIIIFR
jgi:hypothetical protein